MRNTFFRCVICVAAVAFLGPQAAAQHQHGQPATAKPEDPKAKTEAEAQKKDPNRKKPENQPGAVMNAEELAASHADHHEMETLDGGGMLPEGWKHRFDLPTMKLEHVRFMTHGPSLHITSGPPGIYYNPATTATGEYTVKGLFTQNGQGEHREGYGPVIGGADLDGDLQRYTYFLVRKDGKFLIKQREGVNTRGVTDWTTHPAIKPFDANDKMSNELAIAVGADTVRFLINGTEVARHPRAGLATDGIVGLRINHQLDVTVDNLTIERTGTR
jgi:hypothetical protein